MKVSSMRCGRLPLVVAVCALVLGASTSFAATVVVDLDRNTAGIQSTLNAAGATVDVVGAVVVTGLETDTASANSTTLLVTRSGSGDAIDTANTTVTGGDVMAGFPTTPTILGTGVTYVNVMAIMTTLGADLQASIFNFDIRLNAPVDGETFTFGFTSSSVNDAMGITVNGSNFDYPPARTGYTAIDTAGATLTIGGAVEPTATPTEVVEVPTATPTEVVVPPTETPTFTPEPTATPTDTPSICADAGYYVMTSFGQHIKVGNPEIVTGNASMGEAVFVDMEVTDSTPASGGSAVVDLAVLNQSGVVTFVENPGTEPAQDFIFDASSAAGLAVDFQMSSDAQAFWVLTEAGAIFRAGNANIGGTSATAQLGNDAATLPNMLPIPFGGPGEVNMRNTDIGTLTDGSSIRAVAFEVVEATMTVDNANPLGFIVMDSQGGSYLFDGAGNSIRMGGVAGTVDGNVILARSTIYPFFPGLDICRDIDLHPLGTPAAGLVIYDGWGGVHAVPNDVESPVRFMRNETAIGSGVNITTVGLPYLIIAFDNPVTVGVDESASSADVNSIFTEFEFCQDGATDGAYIMDKFGGIFAFGSTRATPDNTAPRFTNSPYFYPYLYAEDMEPVLPAANNEVVQLFR